MGEIHVHEFISLDGVYENPGWTFDYGFDPQMGERIGAITSAASGILLGRKTYEMFAPAWSTRTAEEDPGAPFFNESTKYVVGSNRPNVEWQNTELLGSYSPEAIRKLKEESEGNLYISGSGTLVRALLAEGLVDQLYLAVFPLTLGSGERLFGEGENKLRLISSEAYNNGVLGLTYGPA